ncbi:glucosamine-6-phosphate deaminase [Microbacterium stercoris]|uniref:Glucosamine-6-phosphate deaminase n=1 Tax=Microbacterium stercoris TaxID=2820289 RepID=A0A939QJJ7_9MICO|nr:glucosamine-6-phosphate deaminase [Microbacterium stercoris]MBO3661990.1 glucosamine-6-phosphate deaminase [Microbacterium stercoris]
MQLIIDTEHNLALWAADRYERLLAEVPEAVLGLATGSSPLRVYDELAARVAAGTMSFASARAFTLDEYVGLPAGHPGSYRRVIDEDFARRVDFADGAVQGPDGTASDLSEAAAEYERRIVSAGGIDLQILGIGTNGHIAFNEPGSSVHSRTRVEVLSEQTRTDNARFFGGDIDAVPTRCLTQGIGTILEAREIILLAIGANKASAVAAMVEGAPSERVPATALRSHPRVTVLADAAAAAALTPEARASARSADAVRA